MKPLVSLLVSLIGLTGLVAPVSAEVYRWVDRDGNPHFGDRAAVPDAAAKTNKVEQLPIKSTDTGIDPEAERNRQQLRELDRFRQQQQQSQAEQNAQRQAQLQQQRQRCKSVQEAIRNDQETAIFYRRDEAGNRVNWSSEERIAYREKLQAAQQQYCGE